MADGNSSPANLTSKWRTDIRVLQRALDLDISRLEREETVIANQIKNAAKKKDPSLPRLFAKNLIRTRKTKRKLYSAKSQLISISGILQAHAATSRVAQTMGRSVELMKSMNQLMNAPAFGVRMQEMSKEMIKAGLIEETIDKAIEQTEDADIDEQVDEEIEGVLREILVDAPVTATQDLPESDRALQNRVDRLKERP